MASALSLVVLLMTMPETSPPTVRVPSIIIMGHDSSSRSSTERPSDCRSEIPGLSMCYPLGYQACLAPPRAGEA